MVASLKISVPMHAGQDGYDSPGAARRRRISLWVTAALALTGVLVLPVLDGVANAVAPPPSSPPVTGTIMSFPARDFVSAEGWDVYPFVDVEVLRPDPNNGGNLVRVGFAQDVVPDAGIVEVNHPGGACWGETTPGDPQTFVTPNIVGGDVVRLTGKDNNHNPLVADQTTTAKIAVTAFVSQTGPGTVQMSGTAFQLDGVTPMPAAALEARLISGSQDRFALNNKRDLRAPGAGTLTTDGLGNWTATYTGLGAADVARALAAENRIMWLGGGATEVTIFEVGDAVAPGPSAPCTAPLASAQVATDRPSIEFAATEINTASVAERIRITNVGVGAFSDLTVTSVGISGLDSSHFVVSANQCNGVAVPIAGHCDVFVQFAPTTTGVKSAVVQIQSNAGNTLVPVTATGFATGTGELIAVALPQPSVLGFGTRAVGNTSPSQSVNIKNIGNIGLAVGGISVSGAGSADFDIVADSCSGSTVSPNTTCSVSLTFTPGAEGDRLASLDIASNGAPVSATLTGGGLVTDNIVPAPHFPIELGIFTARDFVSVGGFDPDEALSFQIIRHGVVVGEANNVVAGADGVAEVNHPGGGCWEGSTPDIRPGDVLRVTRSDGRAYEMTNADVKVTQRAQETDPGVVVMKGYARDLTTGGPIPLNQIQARIIGASADPFAINGRRSIRTGDLGELTYDAIGAGNPDGINWTATYDLSLSPDVAHDVALAQTEENRILWLGRDPLALFEMTFWEDGDGVADGPSAPCTAPAQAPSPGVATMPAVNFFPSLTSSETAQRTYSIRNIGTATLNVDSITFGGDHPNDFSVAGGLPGTIAVGAVGTFNVRFQPTALGTRTAVVQINDNAVGSPHTAVATGTGVGTSVASALVTPAALGVP